MDAQRDKLATIVGRTKLTTIAKIDTPCQKKPEKSAQFRVWDGTKFQSICLEILEFPSNTMYDKPTVTSTPKIKFDLFSRFVRIPTSDRQTVTKP